jgi:hypothetical protein
MAKSKDTTPKPKGGLFPKPGPLKIPPPVSLPMAEMHEPTPPILKEEK